MERNYKIELHCHTAESSPCGRVPGEEIAKLYKEAGYDAVAITDHFAVGVDGSSADTDWDTVLEKFLSGYKAAFAAGEKFGIKVYLGAEIRFPQNENDYLVFGLDEKILKSIPWTYETSLEEFFKVANENGLLIIQAHPFRSICTPADPNFLHGVEVYNGHKGQSSHNEEAMAFGQKSGLIPTAGSDCHYLHAVGTAAIRSSILPDDSKGLVELLESGEYDIEIIE